MAGAAALLALAFHWSSCSAADARREVMSNQNVIELVRAGFAADLVNAKIRSSYNSFDMSSRSLIQLKENNVPDSVIQAMLAASSDPAARSAVTGDRLRRELANIASDAGGAREAAFAWLLVNREQAAGPLRAALSGSEPEHRGAAALALARFGDAESLPAMRNLLTDQSPRARALAAEALTALDDRPSIAASEQAVIRQAEPLDGYIRLVGHAKLAPVAEAVGRALESSQSVETRAAAAWTLGEIGRTGMGGRPALERALSSDSSPRVRREAALALAKFHDQRSAEALQNACRTDPEVRKTILAALAEYPEAITFLVEVMNIPPDQIAADETEAARASLMRLTGRDYGLDGAGWSAWHSENAGAFRTQPSGVVMDPLPGSGGLSMHSPQPADGRADEVDLEAWSILADSSIIPTTPPSGALASSRQAFSPFGGSMSEPSSSSSSGASGSAAMVSPAFGGYAAATPGYIPAMDIPESETSAGGLRTWSSDPDRLPPPTSPGGSGVSGIRSWSSDPGRISPMENVSVSPYSGAFSDAGRIGDPEAAGMATPPAVSQPQPFTPTPSSPPARESDSRFATSGPSPTPLPVPGGISLPPPPMDFSDFGSEPSIPSQPPAAFPDPVETPVLQSTSSGPAAPDSASYEGGEGQWQPGPDYFAENDAMPAPGSAEAPLSDDRPGNDFRQDAADGVQEAIAPPDASAAGVFPGDVPQIAGSSEERVEDMLRFIPAETSVESMPPPASDLISENAAAFDPSLIPPPASGGTEAGTSIPPVDFDPSALDPPQSDSADDAIRPEYEYPAAEPYSSSLFVDPEPGQVVIGDPILPAEISAGAADPSGSYDGAEAPDAQTSPAVPSGDSGAPEMPEESPFSSFGATGDFPGESEEFDPVQSAEPLLSVPADDSTPAAFPDAFMDPSKPLPPVRNNGLITAPKGKDLPPMLGEGF